MNTEKFNVGDRVLISEPHGWHSYRHKPGTVTKKTPSGIVTVAVDAYPPRGTIAYEEKFKASGWQWGTSAYHGHCLEEFSQTVLDNEIQQAKVAMARSFVEDDAMWRKLDDETVLKVSALVKAQIAESKSA